MFCFRQRRESLSQNDCQRYLPFLPENEFLTGLDLNIESYYTHSVKKQVKKSGYSIEENLAKEYTWNG